MASLRIARVVYEPGANVASSRARGGGFLSWFGAFSEPILEIVSENWAKPSPS